MNDEEAPKSGRILTVRHRRWYRQDAPPKSRLWIYVGVLLVLGGLALAVWLGRPSYRRYQANRSLKQADKFLAKGDLSSASLCLRQAISRAPGSAEAVRKMAELTTHVRSPAALGWWRRVVELQPTLENKVVYTSLALQIEKPPFPIAAQTLEEIKSGGETNVGFHLVAAQRAIRLNELADAGAHLEAAARLEPTNRLHHFNLSVLRLQSPAAGVAAAAKRELAALTSDPVLGEHALRSLAADALRQQHLGEAEQFSQRLLLLPQATFKDRIQYLTVLHEAKSAALPAAIERAKQQAATNAVQVALTAAWLNGQQRSREALTWLKSLPAATRNTLPVPLAEAECLVAAKDWTGLESRLGEQRWEELEFVRLAFVARAQREQGGRENADSCWRRAVNATAAQVGNAAALLQIAADWGWRDEVEQLLWVVAKRAPRENWPLEALQREYNAATNTAGLYRVHKAFLERHPESLEVKNNVAIFGMLLGLDQARTAALAHEVYEAAKTNAVFVSTYAFALHLQSKPAEGLKLMQALPEPELQRPDIAAYYAVLLSATGQRDKAQVYFAAAEKAVLLPEERRLLAQARAQK